MKRARKIYGRRWLCRTRAERAHQEGIELFLQVLIDQVAAHQRMGELLPAVVRNVVRQTVYGIAVETLFDGACGGLFGSSGFQAPPLAHAPGLGLPLLNTAAVSFFSPAASVRRRTTFSDEVGHAQ